MTAELAVIFALLFKQTAGSIPRLGGHAGAGIIGQHNILLRQECGEEVEDV
ncbi:hypothetical protein [Parafilimonas sp.]|uniref:hypothetical protein n=1 Tax=Parafilimonas sp. TaxID=1969739 RepID=UPI003F812E33